MFLCLVLGTIFVLFPFFWMTATSLKVEGKGMTFEFIPKRVEVLGPFKLQAGTAPEGKMKNDLTELTSDSSFTIGWSAPEADGITFEITDQDGNKKIESPSLNKDKNWIVANSLPSGNYSYQVTINRSWSAAWHSLYTLENFRKIALNPNYPFLKFLRNSFMVAFSTAFLTVILCALAAYVFAKKEFPGKQVLFWTFMSAMMIPGMMFMVPQFALVTRFGWINTIFGLVVPHLANVFGIFMLRQMMIGIPDSLFEAARMDGASEATIFYRIVVPLVMPSLAILFLLTFVGQWNNFLWQLLVNTPESDLITLPVGLAMFRGQYETQWEQMMAASCFSVMPIVILFLFTQRYLIEGLTAGGVKE